MKKLISLSTLILTAIFATSAREYGGVLSENISWYIADSVLTLSGTGATPSYRTTDIGRNPFMDHDLAMKFHTIVIGEGITEVGSFLFGQRAEVQNPARMKKGAYGEFNDNTGDVTARETSLYPNLRSIILPSTLRKIGHHAFTRVPVECINLPEGLEQIGAAAFANSLLRSVKLPSTLRKLGPEAFSTCVCMVAADFNNLPLKLSTGVFFNCEKLRMVLHTVNIRSISPSTFDCSPLGSFATADLLEMFHTDGLENYLEAHMPTRANYQGSDEDYENMRKLRTGDFILSEAANATTMFGLDELTLCPYDAENGIVKINSVMNGSMVLSVKAPQAADLHKYWHRVKTSAKPSFIASPQGTVTLQSVKFSLPDSTTLIAAPVAETD